MCMMPKSLKKVRCDNFMSYFPLFWTIFSLLYRLFSANWHELFTFSVLWKQIFDSQICSDCANSVAVFCNNCNFQLVKFYHFKPGLENISEEIIVLHVLANQSKNCFVVHYIINKITSSFVKMCIEEIKKYVLINLRMENKQLQTGSFLWNKKKCVFHLTKCIFKD